MKDLRELINAGLKCGMLVKAFDSIFQYLGNEMFDIVSTEHRVFKAIKQTFFLPDIELLCLNKSKAEITTAFDCEIAPITLICDEPMDATGWVVTDGWKFEPLSFTQDFAEDAHHQTHFWKDCKPCLPPAKIENKTMFALFQSKQ